LTQSKQEFQKVYQILRHLDNQREEQLQLRELKTLL